MKGKQLFILLVLAAAAGAGWYYLNESNRQAWSEKGGGGGKVLEFPINEVTGLKIKNASGEVNLVKKADVWTVRERADYPANFELVGGLLRKLWELKTVQEVKVGASQLPRLELSEPGQGEHSGTLVEFVSADQKSVGGLLLGKKLVKKTEGDGPMDFGDSASGRYVKATSGPKVSLVSDSLEDVAPAPEHWLAREFFQIDGAKSIAVVGQSEGQSWTLSREKASAEWILAGAKPEEKLDAGKLASLGSILSAPSFSDVLAPDAKPAESGLDKPTTATIETFDGFRYVLKIGKASGENFPVLVSVSAALPKERTVGKDEKPEEKAKLDEGFLAKQKGLSEKLAGEQKLGKRAYLLPKFALEPLLKDRAALLADKPAAPAPTPAAAAIPQAPPSLALPPASPASASPAVPATTTTPAVPQ